MPISDIELAHPNPCDGFIAVSSKIASDPDKSTTIYRTFDALSARNLIFYQAELAELEHQQKHHDEEDRNARERGEKEPILCQRDWETFVRSSQNDGREKQKMDLAMRIREVLEKYHGALAAHQVLLNSPPPAKSTVKAMERWFFNDTAGNKSANERIPHLWGASRDTFKDKHDLIALRVPADQDMLSNFIQNNMGVLFQRGERDNSVAYVSESHISTFVAVIATILSIALLFGAIVSLYFVQNPNALLGMVGGWTVCFAACIGLLTNAKRDQIFGATAAYAAVLVVFVSGNLGGAPPTCICTPT